MTFIKRDEIKYNNSRVAKVLKKYFQCTIMLVDVELCTVVTTMISILVIEIIFWYVSGANDASLALVKSQGGNMCTT